MNYIIAHRKWRCTCSKGCGVWWDGPALIKMQGDTTEVICGEIVITRREQIVGTLNGLHNSKTTKGALEICYGTPGMIEHCLHHLDARIAVIEYAHRIGLR